MPQVNCRICDEEFYAKPSWIKRGHGIYCSRVCQHKGMKNGKLVNCFICNKEVYKPQKALKHSKSKKFFCGKSCQTVWRNTMVFVGSNHFNWKGGEFSYKSNLIKGKLPKICKICHTKDLRVLAVHHVDHNRKNNRIKNLITLCHNCHFLVHRYKEEEKKFMETLV